MPSWSSSGMFETPSYFIANIRKIKWLSHTWITHTQTDQPQNTTQTAMPLFELCRTVPVEWFQYWPLKFLIVLKECMISLCNPRDHCTHSLFQDYCIVKLITPNHLTYLHTGTTLWRGKVLYALVPKTMHGIIVGKQVRTRRPSDRYCTRVWMSGMIWCDH